ncbi:hypothetical protein PSQ90_12270 [Devosia rhodophyticola]|uniref:Secreted protein n=1 Tax=Devosia rhodophyticola TaxID=3026423 RepID=A0ABY7YV42_9HYPH|nr:hypothetical protein [Devosia rhodophyticola]WDR05062.1 hypothetical protein PSQ90_12270 [Devosia rhodophyticola]
MSAIRVAVVVLSAAVAASRSSAVRTGVRAVMTNDNARDTAIRLTRQAAYGAGVAARHLVGRRTQ